MAKAASLASQTPGALSTQLKLPAVFSAPQEKLKDRYISPYVCFAHPKRADEWKKLTGKFGAVSEGEMYFIKQDDIRKLESANMGFFCGTQFWAKKKPNGDLEATSFVELPKPYKEHIEAVVLMYFDDYVCPANIQFRSTKCPIGKALSDALIEASTPEWGQKSPDHAETLAVNQPFGRFYGEVTIGAPRPGKESGMLYRPGQCLIKPTKVAQWRLLDEFSKSDNAQKLLNDAADRYNSRLEEIRKLAPKAA